MVGGVAIWTQFRQGWLMELLVRVQVPPDLLFLASQLCDLGRNTCCVYVGHACSLISLHS